MNNIPKIIINFNYAKNQRESILSHEECNNNINNQLEIFSVPIDIIMDIHIKLAHIGLTLKNNLNNDNFKDIILNDLISIIDKFGDISNFLDINLIIEIEPKNLKIREKDTKEILNLLFYNISMLKNSKRSSRTILKNRIIPLFSELVLSLGFSLNDLREYYFNKLDNDILKLKNEIKNLLEEFDISEIKIATKILIDEMIEKQQQEDFKRFICQK